MNIANYYAANGNQIVIEPLQGSDEKSVRLFALSNAFGFGGHNATLIFKK